MLLKQGEKQSEKYSSERECIFFITFSQFYENFLVEMGFFYFLFFLFVFFPHRGLSVKREKWVCLILPNLNYLILSLISLLSSSSTWLAVLWDAANSASEFPSNPGCCLISRIYLISWDWLMWGEERDGGLSTQFGSWLDRFYCGVKKAGEHLCADLSSWSVEYMALLKPSSRVACVWRMMML